MVINLIKIYLFFEKYRKNIKLKIYLYYIVSFVSNISSLLIPYLTMQLINQIEAYNLKSFLYVSLGMVVVMIIFCFSLSLGYYLENYINTYCLNELKKDLINKSFSMTYNSSKYLNMGKFIQRIFDDTTVVTPLIVSMYANVLLDIFYVIAVIVIMGSMNSILTVIILILIPIFILFYKIYIPYIEKTSKDVLVIDEELKNLSEEALNGQIDIKVNNASKFINLRLQNKLNTYLKVTMKKIKYLMQYDYILITSIMNIGTISMYCFGGYLVFKNVITIGTMIAFTLYFSRLWSPLEYFMNLSKEIKIQKISLNRINELLNLEDEDLIIKNELPEFNQLKIENLTFSYGTKNILNSLNLIINKNDKIAIKGGNGSGKSTLSNIIVKLLDYKIGDIYYNNINYKSLNSGEIRKKIILIPSEVFMFDCTIKENIVLNTDNKCDINKFNKFLSQKDIKPLINIFNLNNLNLSTRVSNNSNNVSGGEKKIIQILRGLFLSGDIYILDEPLNYIDKKYKRIFIDFIKKNLANKTLIIISHDEEIFECCNKIYEINKGYIKKYKNERNM